MTMLSRACNSCSSFIIIVISHHPPLGQSITTTLNTLLFWPTIVTTFGPNWVSLRMQCERHYFLRISHNLISVHYWGWAWLGEWGQSFTNNSNTILEQQICNVTAKGHTGITMNGNFQTNVTGHHSHIITFLVSSFQAFLVSSHS